MRKLEVNALASFRGDAQFELRDLGARRIEARIISEGCSVLFDQGDGPQLVATGSGELNIEVTIDGAAFVVVEATKPGFRTSVWAPWDREELIPDQKAGWRDDASYAQTELKPADHVPPEVADMIARINKQALIRDQLLRNELEARIQAAGRPQ